MVDEENKTHEMTQMLKFKFKNNKGQLKTSLAVRYNGQCNWLPWPWLEERSNQHFIPPG